MSFIYYDAKSRRHARALRRAMTREERHLWYDFLKSYRPQFYRQRPMGPYIVDFYCPHARLVLELDGSQHVAPDAVSYDEKRTAYLQQRGLRVVRFSNTDICQRFDSVCQFIDRAVHDSNMQGRIY